MHAIAHEPDDRTLAEEVLPVEALALVFERTSDAVVIADDAGVYQQANQAAHQLFGVPSLLGRHVSEFVGDGFDFDRSWRAFRARGRQSGELLLTRADGRVRLVAYDATAHVVPHRHLTIMRDVTEPRRRERLWAAKLAAADERRREAERQRAEKDHFIAMLTHELRNAVATVLGGVHVLRNDTISGEQRERALGAISRSSVLEMRLVEDLLQVYRIEAGRMTVDIGPTDVLDVVREAIDAVRPDATTKDLRIDLVATSARAPAKADAERLRQAFLNLLVNAVKFTPIGGRVAVTVDASGPMISVSVADTGCGMRPELLPRIFEPFVQYTHGMARRAPGFGLGLAIVKHIVEAHQGTVRAISGGEGQGATFVVTLPRLT